MNKVRKKDCVRGKNENSRTREFEKESEGSESSDKIVGQVAFPL